jgi:Holliday junction resolvasome RuvABC DNA-binding subunit
VIELRDRMAALSSPALEEELAAQAKGAPPSEDALREDTLSALLNLGYQKPAAEKALTQAVTDGGELTVELLLRRSLRLLSKG